jgi:hypothetical protein
MPMIMTKQAKDMRWIDLHRYAGTEEYSWHFRKKRHSRPFDT